MKVVINLLTKDGAYFRVYLNNGCIQGASVEYPNGSRMMLSAEARKKILTDVINEDHRTRRDVRSTPYIAAASQINTPDLGLSTADSIAPEIAADIVATALLDYFGQCRP